MGKGTAITEVRARLHGAARARGGALGWHRIGLGLRAPPSGRKTWFVHRRVSNGAVKRTLVASDAMSAPGLSSRERRQPVHGHHALSSPTARAIEGTVDLARLGAARRRLERDRPVKVAAVHLILLTGCCPGEVRRPGWGT